MKWRQRNKPSSDVLLVPRQLPSALQLCYVQSAQLYETPLTPNNHNDNNNDDDDVHLRHLETSIANIRSIYSHKDGH